MTGAREAEPDLAAILAKGWALRADFPVAEYERALKFYGSMRTHDERLAGVQEKASVMIEAWTGSVPRAIGSFGAQLNLETSDLDLGVGHPVDGRAALKAALVPHARFEGEWQTRLSTTRLVFAFTVDGVEIDLNALTEDDFAVACRMLDQIDSMTIEERVCHTWVKYLLRAQGRRQDYAGWKQVTYRRFCPEFSWVTAPEKPTA